MSAEAAPGACASSNRRERRRRHLRGRGRDASWRLEHLDRHGVMSGRCRGLKAREEVAREEVERANHQMQAVIGPPGTTCTINKDTDGQALFAGYKQQVRSLELLEMARRMQENGELARVRREIALSRLRRLTHSPRRTRANCGTRRRPAARRSRSRSAGGSRGDPDQGEPGETPRRRQGGLRVVAELARNGAIR
jgi:hypothetical protein